MLEVQSINTFYGTSHILHGISLRIGDGEMFSVLGRNGAGKTTLLRSIMGLNPPRGGSISFKGREVSRMRTHERCHFGIGYVPQGREIVPDLTVRENIELALLGRGRRRADMPGWVFDYFPALKPIMDRKGGVLSGGQQQQLAIARALVQEPELLLLDEPTPGRQPAGGQEV
ncbi:MAG: ATP-binding cassette domain-containing protein, partial [Rhodospirillaceae bacterium]|nr:ATP-binding cassette domain-containing protein [Rhodospirillaceae bacterium]